jgi:hypothetical protein
MSTGSFRFSVPLSPPSLMLPHAAKGPRMEGLGPAVGWLDRDGTFEARFGECKKIMYRWRTSAGIHAGCKQSSLNELTSDELLLCVSRWAGGRPGAAAHAVYVPESRSGLTSTSGCTEEQSSLKGWPQATDAHLTGEYTPPAQVPCGHTPPPRKFLSSCPKHPGHFIPI